ncbi:eukaryotic translation initiation factor 3 subunit F-like [Octopus vulgaris]|uniref:Eukaryotic translation initiation factor 3 subunit F-like n=3 Tax=Octopus TaxID=6643 RepID=A0AA36BCI8_OCTVU|nr:eukaryotic translation initiation factor 3 subunit F [Octopus sinensis]XP_052828293.1 eukaryotic translation initiation factor 3 subunit F [Octopus bimaculoides]CAI9731519.1 eukaryotic translation initiation factor 3 subunit F-like [Octopus vulgaris]
MAGLVCRVHPVVLFSIVDAYERRQEDAHRVIGTLLGTCEKGAVEVSNCFTVPHNESEDEVAVDIEYARNMYDLHRKVNSSEVIVGWFSSSGEISEYSVLIHEYYAREAKNPVHITVDTSLMTGKMGVKAFISTPMGVANKSTGIMFTPVNVEIIKYETEQVAINLIRESQLSSKRSVSMVTDLQQVDILCGRLQSMLAIVQQYVEDVLDGKIAPDNSTGRFLMELIHSVPMIDPDEFSAMLNANIKDLLMVTYLSNLTRAQLALNERLTMFIAMGAKE